MAKRTYTEADKAAVITALAVNKGNVTRTSEQCGVPQQTVRDWKRQYESGETPASVVEQAQEGAGEFADNAERVRDKALAELERTLHDAKPQQLATIVGILDDKIRLARGLATSRTEVKTTLPSPEEAKALMAGFITGVTAAAREREAVIIDAEVVEQPAPGLPAPAS